MIEAVGVTFGYEPGAPVLEGVSLRLAAGLTLLVGPNGCGKSTLLKLLAGVERPDAGTIAIGGRDLWRDEAAARRALAYVPEHPDLSPYASLAEVLELVCRLRGEPTSRGLEALAEAGLADRRHASVRQLSAGQRRRALLAAAWVGSPQVVLLDEPLEALDLALRERVVRWVSRLADGGAAVVVVTHELAPFAAAAAAVVALAGRAVLPPFTLPGDEISRLRVLQRLARGAPCDGDPVS